MKKITLLFLIAVLISGNLFAQEKWSVDPAKMNMYGIGNPTDAPFVIPNYVNPNNKPWTPKNDVGVMLVNPNIRPLPSTTYYQGEVYLTVNPNNPLQMFGGANTYHVGGPAAYYCGYYFTTNGGVTWTGSDNTLQNYGDPGPIFDKFNKATMTYLGNPSGIGSRTTSDFGATWTAQVLVQGSSADKNLANADDNPTSTYYGRNYVVWSYWTGTPYIVLYYSDNSGTTWSGTTTAIVPPTAGNYQQGCDVVTGTAGQVYVTWACPQSGGTYQELFYGFARSTTGGTSWNLAQDHAFPGAGIRGTLPTKNSLRVNSFPRIDVDKSGGMYHGRIYITYSQKVLAPAGNDPDIMLRYSNDQGTTWSSAVRVNSDPINNGKIQFMSAVEVDASGGVNIVYYDDRNCLTDSGEVYVARSVDGGATFTDILVSDAKSRIRPIVEGGIATGYGGDYIGINSGNSKIWPFWMDWRTGLMNIWTTSIDLGPSINHVPLGTTEQTTGIRAVNAIITPAGSAIDPTKTKLYYGKLPAGFTDSLLMTNTSGTNWTQNITLSGPGTYRYYIKTADLLNRVATSPPGAPGSFHSFVASPDTIKPVIVHTPIGNTPKIAWPISCSANVTDNIGIDSVWVYWYKNNTSTAKRFKLLLTSGSTYSALFNSVNADVAVNDSIFYRIIAQDAGSNHKRDSTALYKFKIIQQTTFCIGTGTTSVSNYPFNTFWWGNRTHMLWTSAEIVTAGIISKIAFQINAAAAQTMNGFLIRMQHTSNTTVSGFLQSGWTTVYTGSYTVPGSGWQEITLQTPFVYNGTQNLLVDVCFANTSYTSSTSVLGTAASGRVWYYYADVTTACQNAAGSAGTTLPNVCFTIGTTGVNNNTSEIPSVYSLSQNYPNPFNPVTQIKYDLPKQGLVTLKVYDVIGREVSKLVNEVKAPGSYIVDFDGTSLSSGVYFYKLEVNGFADVKRMVLIK